MSNKRTPLEQAQLMLDLAQTDHSESVVDLEAIDVVMNKDSKWAKTSDLTFREAAQILGECPRLDDTEALDKYPEPTQLGQARAFFVDIEAELRRTVDQCQQNLDRLKVEIYDRTDEAIQNELERIKKRLAAEDVPESTRRHIQSKKVALKEIKRLLKSQDQEPVEYTPPHVDE